MFSTLPEQRGRNYDEKDIKVATRRSGAETERRFIDEGKEDMKLVCVRVEDYRDGRRRLIGCGPPWRKQPQRRRTQRVFFGLQVITPTVPL